MRKLFFLLPLLAFQPVALADDFMRNLEKHRGLMQACRMMIGDSFSEEYDWGAQRARYYQQGLREFPNELRKAAGGDPQSQWAILLQSKIAEQNILGWTDQSEKGYWCSSGAHTIWDEAWSGAHKGFVEHLTPQQRSKFFSLPTRHF